MKDYAKGSTFLVLLLAVIAGCSNEAQEIRNEKQSARSWASTVALIGESWSSNSTPSQFAIKALERSQEAVSKEADSFQSKNFQQSEAKAILESLQLVSSLAGQMQTSIRSHQPDALPQAVQRLQKLADELRP